MKFHWGKEQEVALKKLKEGSYHKRRGLPDKSPPLILQTDVSDNGWVAILLQIINGKKRVAYYNVVKAMAMQTVVMLKAPPYYIETKASTNGLKKARVCIDTHPLPVPCVTDHIPLTWITHTSGKGPVSQFVLDNLGTIDYELKYRPGAAELAEAEAVSWYPCLGPKILTDIGEREAMETLFRILPEDWELQGRT